MVCSSSPKNGRFRNTEAICIMLLAVMFMVRISLPGRGSPQILAAAMTPAVLPVPVPPHRWNTKGSAFTLAISGLAKDAPMSSRSTLFLRSSLVYFIQACRSPLLLMEAIRSLYWLSLSSLIASV